MGVKYVRKDLEEQSGSKGGGKKQKLLTVILKPVRKAKSALTNAIAGRNGSGGNPWGNGGEYSGTESEKTRDTSLKVANYVRADGTRVKSHERKIQR